MYCNVLQAHMYTDVHWSFIIIIIQSLTSHFLVQRTLSTLHCTYKVLKKDNNKKPWIKSRVLWRRKSPTQQHQNFSQKNGQLPTNTFSDNNFLEISKRADN